MNFFLVIYIKQKIINLYKNGSKQAEKNRVTNHV